MFNKVRDNAKRIESFLCFLIKVYILFGNHQEMYNLVYDAIEQYYIFILVQEEKAIYIHCVFMNINLVFFGSNNPGRFSVRLFLCYMENITITYNYLCIIQYCVPGADIGYQARGGQHYSVLCTRGGY